MITFDQLRAQYRRNAEGLARMVEKVKDYPPTKRYRGYYPHQIVELHERTVRNASATDAELTLMLSELQARLGAKK